RHRVDADQGGGVDLRDHAGEIRSFPLRILPREAGIGDREHEPEIRCTPPSNTTITCSRGSFLSYWAPTFASSTRAAISSSSPTKRRLSCGRTSESTATRRRATSY